MTTIINGSSPSITFSDATTQASAGLTAANPVISSGVLTFPDASTQATAPIGSPVQSWQDVSASRSAGVTYTNSTGRPIMVSIRAQTGSADCSITVNGVLAAQALQTAATRNFLTTIVPNNGTYIMQPSFSNLWAELR
jgi:hypothetical protein